MSGESVAQDQIKAFVDRILRLKEEVKAINADIREIYAEAKGNGFDKTILGKLVNYVEKREADANAVMESESLFDLYLTAYDSAAGKVGTVRATHTHEAKSASREDRAKVRFSESMDDAKALSAEAAALGLIDPEAHAETERLTDALAHKYGAGVVDPLTGEITEPQPATAARDLTIPPSPQGQVASHPEAKASTDSGATERDIETPADSVTGEASRASNGAGSVAPIQPETANEKAGDVFVAVKGANARLADAVGVEPSPAALSDHTSKSTAVHTDAGKTGATGGESAAKDGGQQLSVSSAPASAIEFEDSASDAGQAPSVEQFPPVPMKRPPYADCFPAVLGAAYQRLGDDIATNGVQRPIVRMGDVIVDGWARYNICRALSVEYPVTQYRGNDVLMDVIAWQRRDREFTPAQEKQIAAKLVKAVPHRAADILAAFDLAEEMEAAE